MMDEVLEEKTFFDLDDVQLPDKRIAGEDEVFVLIEDYMIAGDGYQSELRGISKKLNTLIIMVLGFEPDPSVDSQHFVITLQKIL